MVWDAAHDALAGDDPAVTLELGADRLGIVNLKNVHYLRPTAAGNRASCRPRRTVRLVRGVRSSEKLKYYGPICLTGQYSDLAVPVEERLEMICRPLSHPPPVSVKGVKSTHSRMENLP